MSDKKLQKYLARYFIGLTVFVVLAAFFNSFCAKVNRVPQAVVITGAVFAIGTIGYALFLYEKKSGKDLLAAKAGKASVTCDCACSIKGRRGFNCLLVMGSAGIILDGGSDSLFVIPYKEIREYRIQDFEIFVRTQRQEYRILCRTPIKLKAASDVLAKKAEHFAITEAEVLQN